MLSEVEKVVRFEGEEGRIEFRRNLLSGVILGYFENYGLIKPRRYWFTGLLSSEYPEIMYEQMTKLVAKSHEKEPSVVLLFLLGKFVEFEAQTKEVSTQGKFMGSPDE